MMRWCLVITLAVACLTAATARPSDGVEIEKLRLVKFPEESFQYQTREQSDETRRILEEINKINVALGYVKKQETSSPAILDSDLYLYPRPSYHPSQSNYNNGVSLPPSIRYFKLEQPIVSRKIVHHHSVMYPQVQDPEAYYYPTPYLRLPHREEPKSFQERNEDFEISSPSKLHNLMAITNDVTSIVEYAKDAGANDGRLLNENVQNEDDYSEKLIGNLKKLIANEANRKKAKANAENAISNNQTSTNAESTLPKFVLLPAKLHNFSVEKPSLTKPAKLDKQRTNTKVKAVTTPKIEEVERGPFGLLRPRPTQPPKLPSTTQIHKVPISSATYGAMNDGEDGTEKYFFLANRKDQSVNKEALKEGGIIIQRLKVRKGGIAIAGPGGVATAGSGGTAIVGPGGLAFTHPRSLTIAGPGARVVALPESYDLEKAIAKAKGRNLPEEGRLVATGPIVYYHPEML